jgi:hypothetical protein
MSAKESDAKKAAAPTDAGPATKTGEPSDTINSLFHEAMLAYEKALESGIQLQEDSVNLWKELLAKIGTPEALRSKLDSVSADLFPNARKGLNDFIETLSIGAMFANRTGKQTRELFGKSLSIYQSTSIAEAQHRVQDLIEETLATGRENMRTILNTNARIMGLWKDLAQANPMKGLWTAA